MYSMNGTIQCALGMGLANVPWEGDYPMYSGNGTSQCAQRMGLANMLYEWDYTMCPRNGAVKSAEYGEAGRGEVNSVSFQIDSKTHKI